MLFTKSLVALVATAGLGSLAYAEELPSGGYSVVELPDGTRQWTPLDDSTAKPYITTPDRKRSLNPAHSAKFSKRRWACWGNLLNEGALNLCTNALRDWATKDGNVWRSRDRPSYVAFTTEGIMVYYCINAPYSEGNLNIADVDFAVRDMDTLCYKNVDGWYNWDRSVEIVGRSRVDARVCEG